MQLEQDRENIWKISFYQPVKIDLRRHDSNIKLISIGDRDDYVTGFLLDYPYFKEQYKMVAIDVSKQQALDANAKEMQQINSTKNLDQDGNKTMFFTIKEAKETISDFSQGTVRVWQIFFLNVI